MDNNGDCVRVAVNIRPLITPELLNGAADCITLIPGEPQVQIGPHAFTYDYVYGTNGSPSSSMYNDCVAPLVDALFHGYNATVLAYGQTGSGKTYTMGTNYTGDGSNSGIIPKVVETIFQRVDSMKESTEFLIRVSFIEIFKEEVFDLLEANLGCLKNESAVSNLKNAVGPSRVPIQIRETVNGGITLAGVTEAEVRSKEEMASYLSRGSLSRATGSTNMNSQSSRSHAIFTITMEQKKLNNCGNDASNDDYGDDILCSKLHLVDLAGSERAKRTGADGMRFKEGVSINKGLLALGNVISALGDEKRRKEGGHVPYRDSKLTRLLQDSLGGNSKTVMIACVSPADSNAEETLNTLKYANRARNIQNKAVVNRDPMAAQLQRMRSQIEHLQTELAFYRGDASAPFDELQILKHKVSLLEASNSELQRELQERRLTCEHLSESAINAQVEKDKLLIQIESARHGQSWDEIVSNSNQDFDLIKNYVSKIQQLEGELLRLKNLSNLKRARLPDGLDSDDDGLHSRNDDDIISNSEAEDEEKEIEHSSLQERLGKELKELDRRLEQKEAEMKHFATPDTSVLKLHYEKKVHELEQEKRALQKEIEELRNNMANISSASDDGAQKLKESYLQKLNVLESQVAELKKKQDAQAQLLRQKQKSDEAARRLHEEIQRIKTHKVQLQQKIKQESEQFRLWKATREKEVLQLKKEGRRNEYELHKLLALNQRQKMVLQRKSEEAAMATKRLKELLESRKASSREMSVNGNGPGLQALMQAIEHELEVTVQVHEVRAEYERRMEERARMGEELAGLKEEAAITKQTNLSDSPSTLSPGARNSRIFALENMLAATSSTLVSMASHLSEAEERERGFSGRGRWNQVRSLADAKNLMNHLFYLASSSRCSLRDKEVDCREKDGVIRDLKEKVVKLSNLARHLEMKKAELARQVASQNAELKKYSLKAEADFGFTDINGEGRKYPMRQQGYRNSVIIMEDMDTSESEKSETYDDEADDDWVQSETDMADDSALPKPRKRKNSKSRINLVSGDANDSESLKLDSAGEGILSTAGKSTSGVCCTCSRYSSCKTNKCQCRAAGSNCGVSCGCIESKCSNREGSSSKLDEQTELLGSGSTSDETKKTQDLASQGAELLQSAMDEKPAKTNNDGTVRRKPLTDIGNTVAKSDAPKRKKKWGKTTIQLVPTAAPPSTTAQGEESEVVSKLENNRNESDVPMMPPMPPIVSNNTRTEKNIVNESAMPLRLPRAMRSAASNSSSALLRERNADQTNESINKENTVHPTRSPARPPRTAEEKENYGR